MRSRDRRDSSEPWRKNCDLLAWLCAAILSGCATIYDAPINLPLASAKAATFDSGGGIPTKGDDLLIALAFSGGGTRAAAFSYGCCWELTERKRFRVDRNISLLDSIHYVSGVSGGAITAAYFGLRGRAALSDFPNRFLLRDAEEYLEHAVYAAGYVARLSGWHQRRPTIHALARPKFFKAPRSLNSILRIIAHVLIYASDVYNRTPFVFNATTFGAICTT